MHAAIMDGSSLLVFNKSKIIPPPELAPVAHPEYLARYPQWARVRDCCEGQDVVKLRGIVYLPKREKMSDEDYVAYTDRASFFNATARTRSSLLSSIFRRPATIDLPSAINQESVTPDGMSVKRVLRWMTEEAITASRFGVLTDIPAEVTTDVQPFLALYPAEYILSWSVQKGQLRMVLLAERVEDPTLTANLFRVEHKWQLRMLALDENDEYFQSVGVVENFSGLLKLPEADKRVYPEMRGRRLKEIPFVFGGAKTNGAEPERPLMLDIADINLSHYRLSAILETARHYVGTPLYTVFTDSVSEDEELIVSSKVVWEFGQQDKAEILEFKGTGLRSLEDGLGDKQEQMRVLGARLVSQPRNAAARSSVSDDAANSADDATLMDVVESVSAAATAAFTWFARFRGVAPVELSKVRVTLNKFFSSPVLGARELRAIDATLGRSFRPIDVFHLLLDAGMIPEDTDEKEYVNYLEEILAEERLLATNKIITEPGSGVGAAKPGESAPKAAPQKKSTAPAEG